MPLKVNEHEFKTTYIANFMASYTAQRYVEISMKGGWKSYKHPTEDAVWLADKAWKELALLSASTGAGAVGEE